MSVRVRLTSHNVADVEHRNAAQAVLRWARQTLDSRVLDDGVALRRLRVQKGEVRSRISEAEFIDQAVDFQDDDAQRRWAQDLTSDPSRTLPADKPVPRAALDEFGRVMDKARRTTIAFRFEKGSAQLDTRAVQDVARLARYLSAPAQSGKRYMIAGFADSTGSWAANSRLALDRARAVVAELQKAGIRVPRDSVAPFSYMAPVACNDTEAGTRKNRRVEVWIAR